jgi:hypothetical protein
MRRLKRTITPCNNPNFRKCQQIYPCHWIGLTIGLWLTSQDKFIHMCMYVWKRDELSFPNDVGPIFAAYQFLSTKSILCVTGEHTDYFLLPKEDIWIFGVLVMVFNATFNNISVISWQSVLLMEETEVPCENHRPATSHWQTLSHNLVFHI